MNLDIPGRVDNIALLPSQPLQPLFEAIVNSLDAIADADIPNGRITIMIERDSRQSALYEKDAVLEPIANFVIEDNGIGFCLIN